MLCKRGECVWERESKRGWSVWAVVARALPNIFLSLFFSPRVEAASVWAAST